MLYIVLCFVVTVASAAFEPLKPLPSLPPLKPLQPLQRNQPLQPLKPLSSLQKPQSYQFSKQTNTQPAFTRPQFPYKVKYITSGHEDGQYRPDNSGSSYHGDGQYRSEDAGSYASHHHVGVDYRHDDSGTYIHDNSGDYIHIDVPYEHIHVPYEHQEIGGGEYVHPVHVESIPPAGGYGPPVALKRGNAAGLYDNRNYKIIRKIEHVGEDLYDYLYQTENGIYADEDGKIANKGAADEAIRAKGYYTYTGPDSIIYEVNYTADENGFIPDADHIPTPPPLPEAIARSLAYQRAIGELTDGERR